MAEIGLGHAGAVLCLEASRLARSCSDWCRRIEICAIAGTLVIDEEGVYDPNQYNDRLRLGFKGTMSEAELHWLRNHLQGGKLEKAQKGQPRFRLPTGLVYDPVGMPCSNHRPSHSRSAMPATTLAAVCHVIPGIALAVGIP